MTAYVIKHYCLCGASLVVTLSGTYKARGYKLMDAFTQEHQGEGHASCDAATASRARRRAERKGAECRPE